MELKDLKSGMVVQLRYGSKFLVVRNDCNCRNEDSAEIYFIDNDGYMSSLSYKEDMTDKTNDTKWDICKVWEQRQLCGLRHILYDDWLDEDRFGKLIWTREDIVEMTMEEVCKALGKTVKIVDNH